MKRLYITLSLLVLFPLVPYIVSFLTMQGPMLTTQPIEGDENEKLRERWMELIHKAAPGVSWEAVENANLQRNVLERNTYMARSSNTLEETFANGQLNGAWEEKGSDNIAGNVKAVDYVASTNQLYVISDGGTLWKKELNAGTWTILNKDFRFRPSVLKVMQKGDGSNRIFVSANGQLLYSDNEGQNFIAADGLTIPVEWSGNYVASVIALKDPQQTMYCLVRYWDPGPWQARFWLYRSTDLGQTFAKVYTFGFGDDDKISLCNPYNSLELYAFDTRTTTGAATLHRIDGTTVTQVSTFAITQTNVPCIVKGTRVGGITTLYAIVNNTSVYKTSGSNTNWTLASTLTDPAWNQLEVSMDDPLKVFYGGVNAYRSSNGGTNWTIVNNWAEYYNNTAGKLHADIMQISSFKKTDGTPFMVINNHGGCCVSYDGMITNTNISLTGLRTGQYYDVITDPDQPDYLFAGSQDQGFQRNLTATTPGVLNFVQVISGDYGKLTLTGTQQKRLWMHYPGGDVHFHANAIGGYTGLWKMKGTNLPNLGWMIPITAKANRSPNEVLIGGGNITGGSGSYLISLSVSNTTPYTFSPYQYAYDFRANSRTGTANISTIETVKGDSSRIYVATEDGTFFYTTNTGATWAKTASFTGPYPWYLYGSCIYASRITPGLVWFAGSGYSNPGVYQSANGGQSFTPIGSGLPSTLVYEITANSTESLLFAATEAGPYVYVVAENKWYPMMGATNPMQSYTTVEYIGATNTVRFGTYGRGIWDFKISASVATPTITAAGSATFCQGDSTLLSSSAPSGNQWYKNGIEIPGATAPTLMVREGGSYAVKVTANGSSSNLSSGVNVVVNPIPPAPQITENGATLYSSSSAGNQWYLNNVPIQGATDPSFHPTVSGIYTVKVTASGCASAASNAMPFRITLTAPTVTLSGSTTFCDGDSCRLTSSYSSGNQWYKDGTAIVDATSPELTVKTSGSYTVKAVVNGDTSALSAARQVAVNPIPSTPTITQNNGMLTSSSATGNQWYLNGTAIPGATSINYQPTEAGLYSLSVSINGCTSLQASPVTFSITAINSPILDKSISIGPNPVQDVLHIQYNGRNEKLYVSVVDMQGREVVQARAFTSQYSLPMKGLAVGSYMIVIENRRTKDSIKRMVVRQ